MAQICCGQDLLAVCYRTILLRCYCPGERKVSTEQELGFLPTSLQSDSTGTLLVASSPNAHAVLRRDGVKLVGGPGPIALDADKKQCLLWAEGRLHLYQLSPFQLLRAWEEAVPQPRQLQFSRDGRRALSLDEEGEYRVWEVDEESRVFERNLLMTPGQTYPQLIAGYAEYQAELGEALQLFEEKRFFDSYQSLQRARSISGFQQAEEALHLQWALCAELQRDGLEAFWERLSFPDIVSGQLTSDGRRLLLATDHAVEIFAISGPKLESQLKFEPEFPIFSVLFLRDGSENGLITVFGIDGEVAYYDGAGGDLKYLDKLKTGRLSSVQTQAELALIQNSSGQAFAFELGTGRLSEPLPLMERSLKQSFILSNQQALLVTYQGPLMADLSKAKSSFKSPMAVEDSKKQICFCAPGLQVASRRFYRRYSVCGSPQRRSPSIHVSSRKRGCRRRRRQSADGPWCERRHGGRNHSLRPFGRPGPGELQSSRRSDSRPLHDHRWSLSDNSLGCGSFSTLGGFLGPVGPGWSARGRVAGEFSDE